MSGPSIAQLGVRVASDGVEQTADDLERLVAAGSKAQQVAGQVGTSWGAASKKVGDSSKGASEAIRQQREELGKLLGAIDPVTGALDKLDAQQKKLRAFKTAGLLDKESFDLYNSKIETARTGLGNFDQQLTRTGNTAKQTAAAMRMLPAQMSDIVVSLQAGQSPLTVFLQQGAQIKDSFGGAAPALRAFGGYIAGMVNPVTAAAAAVGVLGLAYYQGSKEADAYRLAIVGTGNAAGVTTSQLAQMAKNVGATVGTTGQAAEVLAKLAATGSLASGNLEQLAVAAVSYSKQTGTSIDSIVGDFARLAKDPVAASRQLTEQMGYLSAATFQQIQALAQQGDQQSAASLAEQSYADALKERADFIKANLGYVETAWNSVAGAAKGAWDAFLDIGREETFDQKFAKLQERLKQVQMAKAAPLSIGDNPDMMLMAGGEASIRSEFTSLLQSEQDSTERAWRQRMQADNSKQASADLTALQTAYNQSLSKEAKLKTDLAELDQRRGRLLAQEGIDRAAIEKQYNSVRQKLIDDAAVKPKKIAAPALDTTSINALQNQLKLVVGEYENADRKIEAAAQAGLVSQRDAYTQRAALLDQEKDKVKAAYDDQIASIEALQGRGNLSAQQRISLEQKLSDTQAAQTKALEDINTKREVLATKEQGRLNGLQQSTDSYTRALDAQVDALRLQGDQAAAAVGMGREQAALYGEMTRLAADYAKKLSDLDDQKAKGLDQAAYEERLIKLQRQQQQLQETAVQNYQKVQVAQADWVRGANGAWQDYLSNARDVAGQTRDAFTDGLKGIEDYLLQFITRSKISLGDLVRSIAADFARIELRQLIAGAGGGNSGGGLPAILSNITGSGSGTGSTGGTNAGNLLSYGQSAYKFLTGTGADLYNAFQSGGLQGVYDYGASSLGSMFGSATANTASIGASQAGYTGAQFSNWTAAQGASAGATTWGGAATGLGAIGGGLTGAVMGYQNAGWKGAVAGGVGGWGGATLGTMAGAAAAAALSGTAMGAAIGSIIPGIGTLIGAALGAAFGSKLFGGAWVTKDTGIALGVDSGDLQANSFAFQKKKGGLFSSNKKRTELGDLPDQQAALLQQTYDTTEDSVEELYRRLGVSLNDGVLSGLTIGRTQISTKGKTDEEIQKEITTWFAGIADSMTMAINDATSAGLGGYNFESLRTFVNNLYSVNDAFRYLNIGMFDTSVAGGKLAESMSAAAGGLSALQQNAAGYYQNFFSDTEKANDTLAEAVRQFGLVNITLPATREGFRDLVKSMDKTTESGQAQIATLLGLQAQADAYYDVLEARSQQAAQALAEAQAAMLNGAMATLQRAAKREQDALAESYAARTAALNASLSSSQSAVSSLTSMTNSLTSALRTLQGQSDAATSVLYGQATATLESAAAIARAGGSLANFQGLDQAVSTVAGNSAGRYGDWLSFARDQGRSTALINELSITAGDQLTNAEKSVKTLQDQLDLAKKSYDFQVKGIQSQLDLAQAQLDGINGVNNTLLSLAEALKQFGEAVGVARPGGTGAMNADSMIDAAYKAALGRAPDQAGADYWKQQLSSGAVNSNNLGNAISQAGAANGESINTAYQAILGRVPDAAGLAYWQQQVAAGNVTDVAAAIRAAAMANGSIPAFASGGQYMGGKALVGEQGPEIIDFAQPGYVYNARQTAGMLSEADLSRVIALLQQILNKTDAGNDRLFWIADNTRKAAVNTQVLRNQAAAEGAPA
ncbi:phage tail length tape measure family protein [Pseudomonas rhizoryzae]|uniref:phage tail length tape measure family protein n=1 Tax=Pseudomonas rhizoryzae TaxID=2571129 RepID=UPI001305424D|nr:phage tail length tape measure family protein [Pseudomonas rhizoryzae]